jgi:type III pantothenate kinase
LISSVRRDAQQVLVDYLQSSERNNLRIIDFRSLPLKINLEYPERVGIDRLLAAFAASEVTDERPLIVIQAGSAVTVDLVDALGQGGTISDSAISFEGGAILPGVPMMLRLLGKGADMLPEIDADDLMELPSLPGRNTEQAMLCGAASGLIGGVQHLVRRYREAYGASIPVILSGGDGMRLSPYIDQPMTVVPHLVQRGLLKLLESPD